jgi:pimeloyl-ACP methyl ester carboxylesterase
MTVSALNLKAASHGMADIEPGLRLHYVTAGQGPRTVVLLHGFPQTWWEWRLVIPALAERGFLVVARDYRGAGHSWRPPAGYDKQTMGEDIHRLLSAHLGIEGPVVGRLHSGASAGTRLRARPRWDRA